MQFPKRSSWWSSLAFMGLACGLAAAQTPTPASPVVDPAEPLPRPIATAVQPAPNANAPAGLPVAGQATPPNVPGIPLQQVVPANPAIAPLPVLPGGPGTTPALPPQYLGPYTAKSVTGKKAGDMLLEELLQNALHGHNEILAAQSRLREAEMELIRVRQKILVQIAAQRAEYESAKAIYAETKLRKDRLEKLYASKSVSSDEYSAMELSLLKHKADLSRAEAALAAAAAVPPPGFTDAFFLYSSGPVTGMGKAATGYFVPSGQPTPPPMATVTAPAGMGGMAPPMGATTGSAGLPSRGKSTDKFAKTLATPFKLEFGSVVLETALERLKGDNLLDDLVVSLSGEQLSRKCEPVKLKNPIPLRAALQWFEDSYKVRFVVRDYGIVVTDAERMPPGATRLLDVGRQPEGGLFGVQSVFDPLGGGGLRTTTPGAGVVQGR